MVKNDKNRIFIPLLVSAALWVLVLLLYSSSASGAVTAQGSLDSLGIDPPSCGEMNGKVRVYGSGTPPFYYRKGLTGIWQGSPVFTHLGPGTHIFQFRDSSGTIYTLSTVLQMQSKPSLNLKSISHPNCGKSDGLVQITANGPASPFKFRIKLNTGNPTPWQSDSVFRNLSQGQYTLYVKDSNSCQDSISFSLQDVNNLAINTIQSQPPACGQSNGGLNIFANGGRAPLSYSIDGGQSFQASFQFSGLPSGLYQVHVKDSIGCSVSQSFILHETNPPQIQFVQTQADHCLSGMGSLEIQSSGGQGPFEFSLDGLSFQASNHFDSLGIGWYQVFVKDANLCIAQDSAFIAPGNLIQIDSLVIQDFACAFQPGSIQVFAKGGGSLTYSILNQGSPQASSSFHGLNSGNYILRVQNSYGCFQDTLVEVKQSSLGQAPPIHVLPETCGQGNGAISFSKVPGNTYKISAQSNYTTDTLFQGLSAGSYMLYVQSTGSCGDTLAFQVPAFSGPVLQSQSISHPSCGMNSGEISLQVQGGNQGLSFNWNQSGFSNQSSIDSLGPGVYDVLIKDSLGCESQYQFILTRKSSPGLNILSLKDETCQRGNAEVSYQSLGGYGPMQASLNGVPVPNQGQIDSLSAGTYYFQLVDSLGCSFDTLIQIQSSSFPSFHQVQVQPSSCVQPSGSIHITATGNPPLVYSINGGVSNQTGSFTNLDAGQYLLQISDSLGCISDSLVEVYYSDLPQIDSMKIAMTSCGVGGDHVEIFASGGQPPYLYSLGGGGFSSQNSFTGLSNGAYLVKVKDAKGCIQTDSISLNLSQPLNLIGTNLQNAHCQSSNGSIQLIAFNGHAPFQFFINGSALPSSGLATGLNPGVHKAWVIDSLGCSDTLSFTLSEDPGLEILSAGLKPASCSSNNGELSFNLAGGSPPYQISLNQGSPRLNPVFSNLAPGTHQISIIDLKGCRIDTSFTILQLPPPQILKLVISPETCGNQDAEVIVTGTGLGLSYSTDSFAWQSSPVLQGIKNGWRSIYLKDSFNCVHDTLVYIPHIAGPSIDSLGSSTTTCGQSNGFIDIMASGGNPPYTYSINGGGDWFSTPFHDSLGPGVYSVIVRDSLGCEAVESFVLSAAPMPVITSVSIIPAGCGGNTGFAEVHPQLGLPPYEYNLNGLGWGPNPQFFNLGPGQYQVQVRDLRGCLDTAQFTIDSIPALEIQNLEINHAFCRMNNGGFDLTPQGGLPPFSVSIDMGLTYFPSTQLSNLSPGFYPLTLRDSTGCTYDTLFQIQAVSPPVIHSILYQEETCGQYDGSIQPLVSGSGSLLVLINGDTLQGSSLGGISQGQYYIQVVDSNGCMVDTLFQLHTSNGPRIQGIQADSSACFGGNALTQISISHGVPPYEIAINQSQNFLPLSPAIQLPMGSHSFIVRDAQGCMISDSLVVPGPAEINFAGIQITPPQCQKANGQITFNALGGTPPYRYQLNGVNLGSSPLATGLDTGFYKLVIVDQNGCTKDTNLRIDLQSPLRFKSVKLHPASCSNANGKIEAVLEGGQAPYLYSSIPFQSNFQLNGLSSGYHMLSFTDQTGCLVDSLVYLPSLPEPSFDSLHILEPSCELANGGLKIYGLLADYEIRINGGAWSQDSAFHSLAKGNYLIEIKDSTGCIGDSMVQINQAPLPKLAQKSLNPATCGLNNGSVELGMTRGNAQFFLHVNSGISQNHGNFQNLETGAHWFLVQDSLGCQDSLQIILPGYASPSILRIDTARNCMAETYDLNVLTSGGFGGKSFRLNQGAWIGSGNFSGLTPGWHNLEIKDQSNCKIDTNIFLPSIEYPQISGLSIDHPSCSRNDGRIEIIDSNTFQVTYRLDSGQWNSKGVFKNLGPGLYQVQIKAASGCVYSQSVQLVNQISPNLSISSIQNPACGYKNGSIALIAQSSHRPLEFAIDSGQSQIVYQVDSVFNSLSAQSYSLLVRDTNGCIQSQAISLFEINNMAITQIQSSIAHCGKQNGHIIFQGSGGTPPLTYSIDSGKTFQTSGSFPGLVGGLYHLMIQDAKNCTYAQAYTLKDPVSPQIDLVESKALSCNLNNGSIRIFASEGKAPYSYSVDGGLNFQTSPFFNALNKGMYYLVVKDSRDCFITDSVYLDSIPKPEVQSLSIDSARCAMVGGELKISAKGTGLLYSIDGGLSYTQDSVFRNLAPGIYSVKITDSLFCSIDTMVEIHNQDLARVLSVEHEAEVCGRGNGKITIHASGNTQQLQYSLDGGILFQSDSVFNNLKAGKYSVLISHPSGCQDSLSFVLPEIQGPQVQIQDILPSHCGVNNANAKFSVLNGTPPFRFSLNGTSWQSDSVFQNLSPGVYQVFVKDSLECLDILSFQVGSLALPQILLDSIAPAYCGNPTGEVHYRIVGGMGPYALSLQSTPVNYSGGILDSLAAGWHRINLVDSMGCQASLDFLVPGYDKPLAQAITLDQPLCETPTGKMVLRAIGHGPFQYSMDAGVTFQLDSVFTNLYPGFYDVVILDGNSCRYTQRVYLESNDFMQEEPVFNNQRICLGESVSFSFNLAEDADSCMWILSDGHRYRTCDTLWHTFSRPGPKWAQLEVFTEEGCYGLFKFPQAVYVDSVPEASFESPFGESFRSFDPIPLINTSQGADSSAWFVNGTYAGSETHPELKAIMGENGDNLEVCLEAYNSEGCFERVCQTFVEEKKFAYYIPNAFTPNQDGQNEEIRPVFQYLPENGYEFRVIDRYGMVIFQTLDPQEGWDGRDQNTGKILPIGNYAFHMTVTDPFSGKPIRETGSILLLK